MSYVQLTRNEFEDWLGDIGFRGQWKLKPGKGGVYQLFLSPTVTIEINSTTGSGDAVMERGQASMSLRLVSRIHGRTLNKKAMGQSHFARTINWRDNWKKGVDRMRDAYIKAKDFYDNLASIKDYDAYQKDLLALIEGKPHWKQNKFLTDLHDRLQRGGVLTPKQREALERPAAREAPMVEDPRLVALREVYVQARRAGDEWTMQFTMSLAQQLKAGRSLSPKQEQIIADKARRYQVRLAALAGTDTASFYVIAPEQLHHIVEDGGWADLAHHQWDHGEGSRTTQNDMEGTIRQHGGAVFHTGGDGFWDVKIEGSVAEFGYLPPYGTPEYAEHVEKLVRRWVKKAGW